MKLPDDPIECAIQLRQWANDETLGGVKMTRADCAHLADLLDVAALAPDPAADPAPKWDDPEPAAKPAPPPEKAKACEICGVYPAPADPCGFGACPNNA